MASIWGKILGGVGGFAVGGPLGALVGAAAGHAIDSLRGDAGAEPPENSAAFTIACIALGAKMAKADGQVTRDEVNAFKEVFAVPPDQQMAMGRLFDQAKKDARGFEPYARQIAGLFADRPDVLGKLLAALFHIAKADGVVSPAEIDYLRCVAQIFGFPEREFERVRATHMADAPGAADDPYVILGVAPDIDDAGLRAAHRQRVKENHPDTLIARGMPEELVALATEELARINAAWKTVKQRRGLK